MHSGDPEFFPHSHFEHPLPGSCGCFGIDIEDHAGVGAGKLDGWLVDDITPDQ
jgi:hypothetical protein